MTASTSALTIHNLSKHFKDKKAVNDISLDIKKGEIYSFLGPNGAGKSTTIKMLITLLKPDGGKGEILGYDLIKDTSQIRLLIGVALQEASLDESQTGVEFLRLQGKLYGLTGAQINQRIEELTPLIDIGEALNKPIKTYSGGMKRRLDLAASIMHNPKILFLDEPTTGLDPINRTKVWSEIRRLNKELGMTIFLTTQYLEEADQLADRVGIIVDGKLVAEDTPDKLKQTLGDDVIILKLVSKIDHGKKVIEAIDKVHGVERNDDALIITTQSGSDTIGEIIKTINKENLDIAHLEMRETTLDDVFLSVTGNYLTSQQ